MNELYEDDETMSKIISNLNTKYSTELGELVDMTFGPKPEAELQRLLTAEVISLGSFGFRLLCHYHRWEAAERNDRMFREHTDETTRIFTIPFSKEPHSKDELLVIVESMINTAKESYLKGFD